MNKRKLKNFIRKKGAETTIIITICGLIGIPILFWFAKTTIIGIGTIFCVYFIAGLLGLIQWKYFKTYVDMSYNQFALYAFAGFGICLLNITFFLNFILTTKTYSETYDIYREGNYNEIIILNKTEYIDLERTLNYYINNNTESYDDQKNKVKITFTTGILGFDKINNCEFK